MAAKSSKTPAREPKRSRKPRSDEVTATDHAYAEIKRRINVNELPAGLLIKQHVLAEMLGLSRTPVREALIRIAEEGLVEIRPRYGVLIRPFTLDELAGIHDVLMVLEAHAARRVEEQGAAPEALAEMDAAQAVMVAAVARQDIAAWVKADEAFHKLLAKECGNAQLSRLVHGLWDQLKRVRNRTQKHREMPVASNRDHVNLLHAIRRRNAQRAFDVQLEHRMRGAAGLLDLLKRNGFTEI